MPETSALGPIDPNSIQNYTQEAAGEQEKAAPWIVRKLVGSMTGRIVMSSYETLRAAGTNVICLSPWGDSSPLFLPCIRFRDLAVHTVIAATGGMAAVAAPVMGPMADVVVGTLGDSILVELGMHAGFELSTKLANDLVFDKSIKHVIPIHSKRLETTGCKVLLITLKYKHTMTDAALGFYRSSLHSDASLFSAVKDYLAVEKGWFSPYLFASARRPIIPRNMKPDVIFCHGPFLQGDYRIGETLLAESAASIQFCEPPLPGPLSEPEPSTLDELKEKMSNLSIPSLSTVFSRSRTPSPEPELTPLPPPPVPRRLLLTVVGLKPHRKLWTSSARPGESVMNYILLNGCPSVVVPVKTGAPLVAWDGLTLEQLWEMELPAEGGRSKDGKFEGVVDVLYEFLDLCVDWDRVVLSLDDAPAEGKDDGASAAKTEAEREGGEGTNDELNGKKALKDALTLLVAAAIRSRDSKEAKKELDADRSGIAMWRIP
ncbi:hypothetical protein BDN70DRAFT_883348 [Pholiota conissans]|uniref:Uncharacterized protein n=1 Tax=Pholiota conissans TaxID=109636 RepID=A0A9P5YUA2_9AGAR|nr:hypothetical protein BDN70DRAFT_883348 [Pholiota conissans]